ncbi:MAG TPA: LysR family transcriptional regulator [Duganella sp.]|uniref:LysR family transcriptional regulator n=1 Tax=Duganella sp. TaxID=1904440 RepID=UPI002ED51228
MSQLVSLRHLRAFLAVADTGSVTKAADALYRAQSAVTRSVRQLELTLGAELFERKTTRMLCTAFGNLVLGRARRVLAEFEQGCGALARARVPMAMFNERRLLCLVRLAESGHMPTVAKALGISQPAVSGFVNDLEASLGADLFERSSKGMRPTAAGDMLVLRVKRALAELRHIDADLAALRGNTAGRVVIGALPLGRTAILPRAISDVLRRHPGLRFATVEGPFDQLAAQLRAGDIDFVLGALRPADYASDLSGEALLDDRMSLVVRTGHPLTGRAGLGMADLVGAQWVLSSQATPARALFDLSFQSQGLAVPRPAVETSDLAILRGMLMHGDAVTAISPQQLTYEIEAGLLTVLDVELPQTSRTIGITQRSDSHASPGALELMATIRRLAATQAGAARPQPR